MKDVINLSAMHVVSRQIVSLVRLIQPSFMLTCILSLVGHLCQGPALSLQHVARA